MKKANSIKEAMKILTEVLLSSEKDEINYIKSLNHATDMIVYHHSMGRKIRNDWGLWEESPSQLKEELLNLGLGNHPDDMSGVLLEMFFYHVKFPDKQIENIINEFIIKKLLE